MTALEIINKWCDIAHDKQQFDHKACFWVIRDLLQGNKVSDRLKKDSISWFLIHVKDTPEKKKIKEVLGI